MMPREFNIYRRPDGRLATRVVEKDGEREVTLQAVKCFPWSAPEAFISLRDDEGKEIYLIDSLSSIRDDSAKQLIELELEERTYLPHIEEIEALDDEIDLFRWKVKTDAGLRVFYTRRREIPREIFGGGVILKDISGDRYLIPNLEELNPRGKNSLWLYLD